MTSSASNEPTSTPVDRRSLLAGGIAAAASLAAPATAHQQAEPDERWQWQNGKSPWPLCMDTATIRPASLEDKIRIAAEAGFDAIEPWDGELRDYENKGGNLKELGKRIKDAGLFVPSVIGLWNAIPPTEEEWKKPFPQTRERMRMVSDIGSEFVQVIPQPIAPGRNSILPGHLRNIASSSKSASMTTT